MSVEETWGEDAPGVLVLPSGRRVRGRGLRLPDPGGPDPGGPEPEFGAYLLGEEPEPFAWPWRWLRWPDFRLPSDRVRAREIFVEVWDRAARERVEVACEGGRGRTGTALSCVAVLDGVPAREAVSYVRRFYDERAVETPWQRRHVARFSAR